MLISAAGYASIALTRRRSISALGIAIAFVALGLGIGAAETVSNELIISNAPAEKAGAASAVSETAYELGAVLGTAMLGTILTASYRPVVDCPEGLTRRAAAGSAVRRWVAPSRWPSSCRPDPAAALLESARHAFDSGVGLDGLDRRGLVLARRCRRP